jgi:5-methylcytosine-specific restriction endonuclease McrA
MFKVRLRPDDILFSKYLRAKRGKCENCGVIKNLQVSHFHGRRKENVRFDEENCDILCFTCHRVFEENPALYTNWKLKKLGKIKYDTLALRAEFYKKRDIKANLLWIKEELKNV